METDSLLVENLDEEEAIDLTPATGPSPPKD
jgi:hypothetical protein